jgi:clan AA aspartic protease (TIGR02281 family)
MSFANKTAFLVLILAVALAGQSHAQTYKWIDDNGGANFTDDLEAIPPQRRPSAVKFREPASRLETRDEPKESGGESPRPAPSQSEGKGDVLYVAPLKARGFSYSVDALVNRGVRLNMLVDTGASFTIFNVDAAKRLGITNLDALPRMPVSTAGGVAWIHLVEIESLSVGGAEAVSIEGGISSQIGGGLDGLLGMSFLGEFVYQVDGPGAKLSLKSARSPDTRGGGDKGWWLTRYNHYVENIRRFTAFKTSLETGAPIDDPDLKKATGFTREDVGKIIAYYTHLLNSLDRRASAVGVPRDWRIYP